VPALDQGSEKDLHIATGCPGDRPSRCRHHLVHSPVGGAQQIPDGGRPQQQERDEGQQPVEGDGGRHHHQVVLAKPAGDFPAHAP